MNSMVNISGGKMAPFPGGVLVKSEENEIVGAVGVSGAAGDEDEYCAIMGVMESGYSLRTVPEKHSCSTIKDTLWSYHYYQYESIIIAFIYQDY